MDRILVLLMRQFTGTSSSTTDGYFQSDARQKGPSTAPGKRKPYNNFLQNRHLRQNMRLHQNAHSPHDTTFRIRLLSSITVTK